MRGVAARARACRSRTASGPSGRSRRRALRARRTARAVHLAQLPYVLLEDGDLATVACRPGHRDLRAADHEVGVDVRHVEPLLGELLRREAVEPLRAEHDRVAE